MSTPSIGETGHALTEITDTYTAHVAIDGVTYTAYTTGAKILAGENVEVSGWHLVENKPVLSVRLPGNTDYASDSPSLDPETVQSETTKSESSRIDRLEQAVASVNRRCNRLWQPKKCTGLTAILLGFGLSISVIQCLTAIIAMPLFAMAQELYFFLGAFFGFLYSASFCMVFYLVLYSLGRLPKW